MGFKSIEISPSSVTPTTPGAKDVAVKAFRVARTETTAALKTYLPHNASIVDVWIVGNTASDATTSASISVGTTTSSCNEILNALSVKTSAGMIRPTTTLGTGVYTDTESVPPASAPKAIYAKYTSSGAESTTVGPWTVFISYAQ